MIKTVLRIALVLFFLNISCSKDKVDKGNSTVPRKVVYLIGGPHFKVNYIDSNSAFHRDEEHFGSFQYEFRRPPGTSIGFSVANFSPGDKIDFWELIIDDKLYANAFSEGGAYMIVPYY